MSLGDDLRLVGIGHLDLTDRFDFIQDIVEKAPVHRGFENTANARLLEAGEEGFKCSWAVRKKGKSGKSVSRQEKVSVDKISIFPILDQFRQRVLFQLFKIPHGLTHVG